MALTRVIVITTSALLLLKGITHAQGLDGDNTREPVPFDFLNAESELYHNLTRNYNKHIRPVHSASDTITVKIGISLIQILNFDESQQKLHALAWIEKTWTDEALRWNPEHFHGIDVLRVPNEVIWKPDILMYNSIAATWKYKYSSYAVVYSTGTIVFIPPIHLESACHVDLTKFPFDEQTCNWTLGSWTYDGNKVDINFLSDRPGIDFSNYRESSEWSVTDHSAKKNVKYYSCCKEPYPNLTFTLKLRRRMGSYTRTLVAPSIIISLLIPVVFLLPTGSTEKIHLGVGVLIGSVLLAILLEGTIPRASHTVPIIVLYNLACVILAGVSLMFAATVNRFWAKSGEMPRILKQIFLTTLGRLLVVPEEPYTRVTDDEAVSSDVKPSSRLASEWRRLARVVDRLCLLLFILVEIIMTIAMLA